MIGGAVTQDVANTAQGRGYFNEAEMDDLHLALVHDNADPTQGTFSVGYSIASLPSGTSMFTPAATGRVNVDFNRITADGNTYCFENTGQFGKRHILVQTSNHPLPC
jgi:hypothetical protein